MNIEYVYVVYDMKYKCISGIFVSEELAIESAQLTYDDLETIEIVACPVHHQTKHLWKSQG